MKSFKKIRLLLAAMTITVWISSCQKEFSEPVSPVNPSQDNTQESQLPQVDVMEQQARETGVVLLSPVEYNKLPKAEEALLPESLPASYLLSCPAIANQGSEGSCVAFGTAYAARSIMERNQNGGGFANNVNVYSPEFVYNQIKIGTCSQGSYVSSAFNLMKNSGVPTWAQMPYSSTNGCSLLPTTKQSNAALLNKITGYSTVSRTVTAIKNQLLANKPVIVAGPVDSPFQQLGYNVVYSSYNSNLFVGNHCYCVVGYDDSRNAFKVMNSWGTTWGTAGFSWIHYNIVYTMFQEAYVINGIL